MSDFLQAVTPVGRWVRGDIWEPQTKRYGSEELLDTPLYRFWLAVEKNNPEWINFHGVLQQVAQRDFPQGEWQSPNFSWKLLDGDRPDIDCPEARGHWVVRFSSAYQSQIVRDAGRVILTDRAAVKRGDYIRAVVTTKGNGSVKSPGIFVNASVVEFMGYGEAIGSSGVDAAAALSGVSAPAYVPAGMSNTPIAGSAVPSGPVSQHNNYGPAPQQPQQPQHNNYGPAPQQPQQYGPAPQQPQQYGPTPDYAGLGTQS